MPRINPESLLKCLHVLLNAQGGIRGSPEVKRMVALMGKFSNTLVSKVCYTLILKETEDGLLSEFMAEGGWALVFQWLGTAITCGNNPFIKEVLQLLIKCPISLDRLKESNAPRTVKGLSKDSDDPAVKELARQVVEMWLEFIKSGRAAVEPVPVAVPSVVMAPAQSPLQEPEPKTAPATVLQPFKIVIRDGKRVLLNVGADDSTPPKVKRLEKTDDALDDSPNNVKDKTDKIIKVRDSDHKLVKTNCDASSKTRHKDTLRPDDRDSEQVKVKRKETDSKQKSEKREHSRSSNGSSSSSHKSQKSSQSSSRESGKDKSKDSSRDKYKERPRDKSKDLIKSKPRDKDSHRKTDKDAVNALEDKPLKTTPAISSLGKIPKKTSSSTTISAAEASATGGVLGGGKEPQPLPVAKKGTYSDERKRASDAKSRDRPKTVKTLPTKFRSTGLEEEAKPPPSRADVRKKERREDAAKDLAKRPKEVKDGSMPPEKKPRVAEIKDKLEKLSEKPGGIKLIPPKPKPVLLESDMFSDALTASTNKEPRKKKRRTSSGGGAKESEMKKESGDLSPKTGKSSASPISENKPLKFYRDTLDDADADEVKKQNEDEEVETPRAKYYPEGVLVVHRSRRAPRKSVQWRNETDLVSIQYFELDETERVNVSRSNFMDLKTLERNREREALLMHKMGSDTVVEEKMPWGPLFIVDVPAEKQPPEPGQNSTEKDVQLARQKTVLEAIFFHKSLIPDSPAEPDLENHPMTDPKPIPLDDAASGKDSTFDYSSVPWPEPKPESKTDSDASSASPHGAPGTPIPTYSAPGYSTYPSYPIATPGSESWRTMEENKEMAPNIGYPPQGVPMAPPMYGMGPSYGPPPGGMMGPEGFMYPPNAGFPMQPGYGPMGPMNHHGWAPGGWNGPRGPPLPLEPRNICRSWNLKGSCIRGNQCRFLHPGSNCPPLPTS